MSVAPRSAGTRTDPPGGSQAASERPSAACFLALLSFPFNEVTESKTVRGYANRSPGGLQAASERPGAACFLALLGFPFNEVTESKTVRPRALGFPV
ncbi:hypothetical protein BH09PSE5_BH09PSE5_43070 [soil metagenome]